MEQRPAPRPATPHEPHEPHFDIVPWEVVPSLRRLGGRGKLDMTFSLWEDMRDMITRSVRAAHPDWNASLVQREVARRMSGDAA